MPWSTLPRVFSQLLINAAWSWAQVTLITATHSDADTQNYVYLDTGGRKFLLGSPATPLTGSTGPQVFTLDLETGPLTAAERKAALSFGT